MNIQTTPLSGVLLITPTVFHDARGYFFESWNQARWDEALGSSIRFVQDNHSHSRAGVLRGLHAQLRHPQGKLIRVLQGCIWDVCVDVRAQSPTFGQHWGTQLSAEDGQQLWLPPGFAHGFYVLSDTADVCYKTTAAYDPQDEVTLAWNDPTLQIAWPLRPLSAEPLLSMKDQQGLSWSDFCHQRAS